MWAVKYSMKRWRARAMAGTTMASVVHRQRSRERAERTRSSEPWGAVAGVELEAVRADEVVLEFLECERGRAVLRLAGGVAVHVIEKVDRHPENGPFLAGNAGKPVVQFLQAADQVVVLVRDQRPV